MPMMEVMEVVEVVKVMEAVGRKVLDRKVLDRKVAPKMPDRHGMPQGPPHLTGRDRQGTEENSEENNPDALHRTPPQRRQCGIRPPCAS